jgi:hypothetical protein
MVLLQVIGIVGRRERTNKQPRVPRDGSSIPLCRVVVVAVVNILIVVVVNILIVVVVGVQNQRHNDDDSRMKRQTLYQTTFAVNIFLGFVSTLMESPCFPNIVLLQTHELNELPSDTLCRISTDATLELCKHIHVRAVGDNQLIRYYP